MVNPFNDALLTQFEQYLTDISLSPKTIASYLTDLNVFTRWATETYSDNFSLVEVTPDQIRTYLTYLLDDLERAPSTVNRHLQALRKCCAYIAEVKLAPSNAAEEISLVSLKNQHKPEALSQQNIAALLKAASEARPSIAKRDVAILHLLLNTGLRVAEVIDLQMDDVVFDYPGVHLKVRDSRGSGTRNIPLLPEVCRSLKDYLFIRSKTATSPPRICFFGESAAAGYLFAPHVTPAGVLQQYLQHGELARRQLDRCAVLSDRTRRRIEHDLAVTDQRRATLFRPPVQRAQAGVQLVESKGLDEIVVGTTIEPGYPIGDRIPCRQNQHGQLVSCGAQVPQDVEPRLARQAEVENDEVVRLGAQRLLGQATVGHPIDGMAFLFQASTDAIT